MNTLTISRASIFDALCAAVDEARAKAAGTPWASRVETAWAWLLEQEAFDVVDPYTPHAAVRIPSQSKPGLIYTANGACQCRASEVHNPCWHRAASRLLRNAMDAAAYAASAAARYAARRWQRDLLLRLMAEA